MQKRLHWEPFTVGTINIIYQSTFSSGTHSKRGDVQSPYNLFFHPRNRSEVLGFYEVVVAV